MSDRFTTYTREPTDELDCPNCRKSVRFYAFSGMGDMAPHFYCDLCSNVYFSEAQRDQLHERGASAELLEELEALLPRCPCGGQFRPNTSPKCPRCGYELSHQDSAIDRLTDPYAILVVGASVISANDTRGQV